MESIILTKKQKKNARRRELYLKNKNKILARNKKYYETHKETFLKQTREYALKHSEQSKKYKREHYERNRQKMRDRAKQWRLDNKERYLEQLHKNYAENKEKRLKQTNEYKKQNPGLVNAWNARRRAKKLQATPPWLTGRQMREIKNIYLKCTEISKETGIPHNVDHIIPLQGKNVSGLHVPWNLQIITQEENFKKHNNI